MELDFNKILQGGEQPIPQPQNNQANPTEKKLTQTETRARQQSCMITDIDKNLVSVP